MLLIKASMPKYQFNHSVYYNWKQLKSFLLTVAPENFDRSELSQLM